MKIASLFSLCALSGIISFLLYAEPSQDDIPSWNTAEPQKVDQAQEAQNSHDRLSQETPSDSSIPLPPPPRPGYLESGPSLEGLEQENVSDYSPLVEIRTLRKKIAAELKRTEYAEQENLRLQRLLADAEDKLFQQTTLLESAKKEVVDNEFKSVALEQQLTRLKLSILRKKMLRESRFPPFYTVEKNDSLWKIAAKTHIYDDPYKWIEVFYANKDKIADPDFIYPGMVLTIPRPEFLYEDWTVSELNLDEFQREMSKEDIHALQKSIRAEKTEAQNR